MPIIRRRDFMKFHVATWVSVVVGGAAIAFAWGIHADEPGTSPKANYARPF
jgi:hypothetical protein